MAIIKNPVHRVSTVPFLSYILPDPVSTMLLSAAQASAACNWMNVLEKAKYAGRDASNESERAEIERTKMIARAGLARAIGTDPQTEQGRAIVDLAHVLRGFIAWVDVQDPNDSRLPTDVVADAKNLLYKLGV